MSSTLAARVLLAELTAAGVGDVVLAPGSRSAPLAFAVAEAEGRGELRLHVRIDERSAAFLALGLAKASGRPTVVITTSGTAVANLHPAVLEAHHAHVPLVVLSADRPATMINTGANQTTDQVGLFGAHVRAEARLSAAQPAVAAWAAAVHRMTAAATGVRSGSPGPVHLNVEFTEPLTPTEVELPTPTPRVVGARAVAEEAVVLASGPNTVVVAGDGTPTSGAAAREFAAAARLPLLAEPSSAARHGAEAISTYRLLLESPLADRVERVVVFGHPTLSRPVQRLLGRPDVEVWMVSEYADWVDPQVSARAVVSGVRLAGTGEEWLEEWRTADRALSAELAELLADDWSGPVVAATLWPRLRAEDVLVLGSSNPIRDVDLAPVGAEAPLCFSNRGLAGIDGTVSTAVGIALASGRPTHLLLGDLTFLHDANGLVIGPEEPRPDLRIVVANDDGGSIFSTLEQGAPEYAGVFERVFGTPHGTDLAALAATHHLPYRCVADRDHLEAALAEPVVGMEIIEARIDRGARRDLDLAIRALPMR